ncbi:Blp family class II bacteriocin [Mucilaginibacter celer]|uniref:Bacteriocin n=1 Tax=Mucilaginibacter celer TaxID=2305508 RepID=A0A494VRS9_9SPHI|nr:Blp family class II bacteriocin [Mucilaginibacter celer]AYL97624.1 hypothetical protein HYN43_021030 [Mucilaginibacter celer]
MKKLSVNKLNMQQMEQIEGGMAAASCDTKLAAAAAGFALIGCFIPGAQIVAGAALGAWMSKCL